MVFEDALTVQVPIANPALEFSFEMEDRFTALDQGRARSIRWTRPPSRGSRHSRAQGARRRARHFPCPSRRGRTAQESARVRAGSGSLCSPLAPPQVSRTGRCSSAGATTAKGPPPSPLEGEDAALAEELAAPMSLGHVRRPRAMHTSAPSSQCPFEVRTLPWIAGAEVVRAPIAGEAGPRAAMASKGVDAPGERVLRGAEPSPGEQRERRQHRENPQPSQPRVHATNPALDDLASTAAPSGLGWTLAWPCSWGSG